MALNRETWTFPLVDRTTRATNISVIIPALNEALSIERAVRTCWEAGVDQVVVVDGGSEDDTTRLASESGAEVRLSGPGRAEQQNFGAQHSTGEVLLFLHADNWLAPAIGQQIRQCLADNHALGGAFLQRIEATGRSYRWLERGNAARLRWRGLAYGFQAIFLRRSIFEKLGGFPQVKLMEDLLLMRAFRKLSWPVVLPGPVYVNPRRWQRHGIVRQTLRNWSLLSAQAMGVAPDRLARFYPAHDQPSG